MPMRPQPFAIEWPLTEESAKGIQSNFETLFADSAEFLTTFAIGDILYASDLITLARLAAVASGNALISGGVNLPPSWGKIGLTTHVEGILPVANGGTARASHTAYAVITGGTTSTGAQQSIASVGTLGQVLTSNGAAVLPTFKTLQSSPTVQTTTGTGAQDDFILNQGYTFLRVDNASLATFSGFAGPGGVTPTAGDRLFVVAIQARVDILHQSGLSAATNDVIIPGANTISLNLSEWATMIYDGTTSRWRLTSTGSNSFPSTQAMIFARVSLRC